MKQYLFLLIIAIAACIQKIDFDKEILIKATNLESKSDEELSNDIYFTFCISLIKTKEYEELMKEYLEEVPDDLTDIEVGFDMCKKLAEMEEFQKIFTEMKAQKKNLNVMYDYKSNYKINQKIFSKTLPSTKFELSPSAERIDLEKDIILTWNWKKFWKGLFNLAITVVEVIWPATVLICEGVRALGNDQFDS